MMMRIAAAQTPAFDDIAAALTWADATVDRAAGEGAALLVFPEAYLQGYLTEPCAARAAALELGSDQILEIAERLARDSLTVVLGLIERDGDAIHNTAVVMAGGAVAGRYRKTHLLTGEAAFTPGTGIPSFNHGGLGFGINICFDTSFPDAAAAVAAQGAALIVCPSNNMMPRSRSAAYRDVHNRVRGDRCRETGLWLISADVTGAAGDRICWGPTAVLDPSGAVAAQLPLDAPGLLVFDLPTLSHKVHPK